MKLIALVVCLFAVAPAFGERGRIINKIFGGGKKVQYSNTQQSYGTQGTYSQASSYSDGSLQGIAQARASYMAQNRVTGHNFPGAPSVPMGIFEGTGMASPGRVAPTCVGPGRVVADATANDAFGNTYRVRFYK